VYRYLFITARVPGTGARLKLAIPPVEERRVGGGTGTNAYQDVHAAGLHRREMSRHEFFFEATCRC
jgi:hypothetical protein